MLVASIHNKVPALLWWRRGLWISVMVLIVAVLSLASYMTSSTELVRMRNALLLTNPNGSDFDWTPASVPPTYMLERGPVDPFFLDVANRLELAALPDDWERALAISRHLLGSSPVLEGGAIKLDLRGTYQRIITAGEGYCGDFVDVFMAIALAADMPVRSWAFSFDGFGGDGHIWPEIWNRQLGRWQLLDVFNNYYFFETAGVPLSANEFRRAMLSKSKQLKLAPLHLGARVGWTHEGKAWDYYRRGLPEWYMWWGNNVFTYDLSLPVRTFSGVSRSLEQLGGIALGVTPSLQPIVTAENRDRVNSLWRLRMQLFIVAWVATLAIVAAVLCWVATVRVRRRLPGGTS